MNNQLKHRLIDKILVSKDEKLLSAIDQILDSVSDQTTGDALTKEQKLMLEMSEQDIKNNETISQSELDKEDLTWLREK